MSADEDTELRDLVAQTLETNGVLGKIRAQLRANVFLALEEQESIKNPTPFLNKELKSFIQTPEGRVVTSLVREFLEFFRLDFTTTVFEPESGSRGVYEGRNELARDLDIIETEEGHRLPLLAEVVKRSAGHLGPPEHAHTEDLPPKLYEEARAKFMEYDKDGSGSIDKDELRELFCDIFPSFNRHMLDRYVNDEFQAYDKDFSARLDFEEFLDMYKRLFVLSKSVVSQDVHEIVRNSPRSLSESRDHSKRGQKPAKSKPQPSVEEMNKKNLESSSSPPPPQLPSTPPPVQKATHINSATRDLLMSSDVDDDSFFDDKLPNNNQAQFTNKQNEKANGDKSGAYEYEESPRPRTPETDRSIKSIDKKFSDLGMEPANYDDYDDDFDTYSKGMSSMGQTPRGSERLSPRSLRSESVAASIPEDLDEDLDDDDEELSGANDLLNSDNSNKDDLTTDRTVSPHEMSQAFDYAEQVHLP